MSGAPNELEVRYRERRIGGLRQQPDGVLVFAYEPAWRGGGFPLSLSLPILDAPYVGGAAHAFFANLLPEGAVRQAVCARLGISVDNDFSLLRAIGGECAGAISIVPPDQAPPDPDRFRYEAISDHQLAELVRPGNRIALLAGGRGTRLSLAGAQDKVPVFFDGRVIHLPLELAPSTHILKLPSATYAHLTVNEAYVGGLAARAGLEVAGSELVMATDPPALLVERYDRVASDTEWPAIRLHQEDLCQALGIPAERKYEQDGGPSFVDAVEVVRTHVVAPLIDGQRMLAWQAFNVVAGNSDGHAKNLSLLYGPNGLRLAPHYDLLSTRYYPALDRGLAMAVGGRRDPDLVGPPQWRAPATALRIAPRAFDAAVAQVAGAVLTELDAWTAAFRDRYGRQPVLQRLPAQIRRRAERIVREYRE